MPNKLDIIVGAFAVGVIGFLGFCIYSAITEEIARNKFNKTYTKALYDYADTDRNNVISSEEKENFIEKILEGKNTIYVDDAKNKFRFKDTGRGVSDETLTEWIEEYVTNQKKWSIFQK